ncbi:mRNA export factor mex67 [Smittium culicis]|uniref:mRNA export factor MEX67 n=1 Tax=Smittium culicis TaxID=133412 RepID=A0A1R1YAP0_9FUNG|nr:mRNA export factor mex67 [Smittium culicis]
MPLPKKRNPKASKKAPQKRHASNQAQSSKSKALGSNRSHKSFTSKGVSLNISGVDVKVLAMLRKYLIKKTNNQVTILKLSPSDSGATVVVNSHSQADKLIALNGSLYFGKAVNIPSSYFPHSPDIRFFSFFLPILIQIELADSETSSKSLIHKVILKFLETRILADSTALNLQQLNSDPTLLELGINPIIETKESKVIKVLFLLASKTYPKVPISLFPLFSPISSISLYFPKLKNLSLQSNPISSLKELDFFSVTGSTKSLSELRELILIDTTARNNELSLPDGDNSYIKQVTVRFPTIEILDLVVLSPEIRSYAAEESKKLEKSNTNKHKSDSYLPPIKLKSWDQIASINPSFSDSPESTGLAQGFIAGYFQLYDKNRSDLVNVYSDDAIFSLNVNVSSVSNIKQQSNISNYIKYSRNLTRIKNRGKRTETLITGNQKICEKIKELPASSHNLSDASKITFDCWSMVLKFNSAEPTNCIMLVVHGMFNEIDNPSNVFSFDRTFILSEAPPTSLAFNNGWPCIIKRDLFTIRNHNSSISFLASALPEPVAQNVAVDLGVPNGNPNPLLMNQPAVSQQQLDMQFRNNLIQSLSSTTRLNLEWSEKCLADTNWDLNKAIEAFSIFKDKLPPQAFI